MSGRVSSREQAENSSLESQKAELMYLEIGSATAAIENRPIFFKLINQILKKVKEVFPKNQENKK